MALGHQDPWLAGSKMYFKRDNIGATQFPLIELGDIDPVSPAFAATKIEAVDSSSGRIKTRDERTIELLESYQVTCRNLRNQNLALLFLSLPPIDFVQSAAVIGPAGTKMFKGELSKVTDAAGVELYGFDYIMGLYTGTVAFKTLTAISRANKTLTVTTDITASLTPGDSVIVDPTGLANKRNARSYTIVSSSFGGGSTTIVVAETPAGDETAVTGTLTHENGGTIYNQGLDWVPAPFLDPAFGYVKVMPAGAIVDGAINVNVRGSQLALSGNRIVKPKSLTGEAQGQAFIVWSRGGDAEKTYREFRCSIAPVNAGFAIQNFSNAVFGVKVLTTPGSAEPAGKLLQAVGTLPLAA